MLTSKRRAALILAALMLVGVAALRVGVASAWDLGERDVQRFADRSYGFQVSPETDGFFLTWTRGDGQAFISIASDLNGDGVSAGLGYQAYRMTRIAPSVIARLLVLGDTALLPYGLAAGSFLAYIGLLGAAVRLTDSLGLRAMLLGMSPAAVIGTIFDTSEGLGSLLLVVAITATSTWLALAAGALLGVSRPSYGTAVIAARAGIKVPMATLLAALSLQLILLSVFDLPFGGSGNNLVMPFTGYVAGLPGVRLPVLASAAAVIALAIALAWRGFDRRYQAGYRIACGASALLAFSIGPSAFVGPMSPLRITGGLVVLAILSPLFTLEDTSARLAEGPIPTSRPTEVPRAAT